MDVKLIVQGAKQSGQVMRLRTPETIIGRQRGCGVRVPSGQVSRQHCLLSFQHDVLAVEDLNSANGTFVNGRRIARREPLRPGDKLTVGPVTMLVQYQLSEAGVQYLLGADQEEFVAVPLDEVRAAAREGGAEVEVVLDDQDAAPLIVEESLDEPTRDPLEALRAIEAKATAPPKKAPGAPRRRKPVEDDRETLPATPPVVSPPREKVVAAPTPAASPIPFDEDESDTDAAPNASQILGNKNWQLPTGEDIRDILAQIEKGRKQT